MLLTRSRVMYAFLILLTAFLASLLTSPSGMSFAFPVVPDVDMK